MKKIIVIALALMIGVTFASCKKNPYKGFKKTESGVYYKNYVAGTGEQVKTGDVLELLVTITVNDTVRYSSNGQAQRIELVAPQYAGDLMDGLASMKVGDSTTFIILADDIRKNNPQIPATEDVKDQYITIKLLGTYNEAKVIEEYLKAKNITDPISAEGIYFLPVEEGKGNEIKAGQTVKVNYVGRLLDGKLFDTNLEDIAKGEGTFQDGRKYEPMEVKLGAGQVIPGFEAGILKMKKGGKATVIIPSQLAYGGREIPGMIPAYSTLVFSLEIVDVK